MHIRPTFNGIAFAVRAHLTVLTALFLCFFAPSVVWGAPIFTVGPGGGNPAENLLFNNGNLVLGPGNLVQGVTNNTGRVLDITSAVSIIGNGGQARIEGTGGAPFGGGTGVGLVPHSANNLPGGLLPMGSFTDVKFNIDAIVDGTVSFSVVTNLGTFPFASTLDDNGQNFFRFTTLGTEVITKVTITSAGNNIDRLAQIRLGGVVGPAQDPGPGPGANEVPEPTSLLAWACIGMGLAGAAWRRRIHARRGAV